MQQLPEPNLQAINYVKKLQVKVCKVHKLDNEAHF